MDKYQKMEAKIKRHENLGIYKATTYAIKTTGKLYHSKRLGWASVPREAKQNAIIFNTMKKQGRDVKTLDESEVSRIKFILEQCRQMLRVAPDPESTVLRAMKEVATYIRSRIVAKIANAASTQAPLTPRSQGRKDFETQQKGLPPMHRSGQLAEGLDVSSEKIK